MFRSSFFYAPARNPRFPEGDYGPVVCDEYVS
jgi:hypothetical protein